MAVGVGGAGGVLVGVGGGGVLVGAAVGVGVLIGAAVAVGVAVGVEVLIGTMVTVRVMIGTLVAVGVALAGTVSVNCGVEVGVAVPVGVRVGEDDGVGWGAVGGGCVAVGLGVGVREGGKRPCVGVASRVALDDAVAVRAGGRAVVAVVAVIVLVGETAGGLPVEVRAGVAVGMGSVIWERKTSANAPRQYIKPIATTTTPFQLSTNRDSEKPDDGACSPTARPHALSRREVASPAVGEEVGVGSAVAVGD
ncbi:MAG: hypothetical protein HY259_09340, partial [Chloroflexi bacterium]|nr:hypothetical protein [Chloroflexota bacterium]